MRNKGFSLIEMIIYIAIIAVMFITLVQTVLSFTKSYRELVALRSVDRSAMASLERMTREIRNASVVNAGASLFVTSPGILSVSQTGVSTTTTRFYTDGGAMKVDVDGQYIGPLTMNRTSVTSLVFRQITGTTTAIKIDMTLTASSGPAVRTKSYHATVVLKGS